MTSLEIGKTYSMNNVSSMVLQFSSCDCQLFKDLMKLQELSSIYYGLEDFLIQLNNINSVVTSSKSLKIDGQVYAIPQELLSITINR